MAGATNPGNIGHVWVKSFWVDKKPAPGMERADQYNPNDYAFIRATLDDNPTYANDEAYIAKLDALPTRLRNAFRLGDWGVFAGQYFDNFDVLRHVKPARSIELDPWLYRWISCDWGFAHPACVHFHAQDGNRTITYREIHGSGKGEQQLAYEITEAAKGEKISAFFISPDAYAKRGDANPVAIQIGEAQGSELPYPEPAATDRIGGARLMYGMLQNDLWTISDACPALIECLPTLIHDEGNMEDVLKVDHSEGQIGDDAYDCARYGLYSHLKGAGYQKPLAERVQERIQVNQITDPTSVAIWSQKFEAEERMRNAPIRRRRFRPMSQQP
jgi:hypothetical protein